MVEKLSKNLIAIAVVIAGVLIAGTLFYINQKKGEKITGFLTAQQAAEKTINFVNQYLVEPGMVVSLINVAEKSGLYKISIKAGEDEYDLYTTKDGKLLFFQAIDMEKGVFDTQPIEPTEEEKKFSDEQLKTLAKCLSEKGAKFYGTYVCGFCVRQKEMFGEAAKYLPYVECSPDRATEAESIQCTEANVRSVPDWRFPDGTQKLGLQSVEQLAELSGCPL